MKTVEINLVFSHGEDTLDISCEAHGSEELVALLQRFIRNGKLKAIKVSSLYPELERTFEN